MQAHVRQCRRNEYEADTRRSESDTCLEMQGHHRFQHGQRGRHGHDGHSACGNRWLTNDRAERHPLSRFEPLRQIDPRECGGDNKRQAGEHKKRQADAAELIQPSAQRGPDHVGEAGGRHDDACRASAFGSIVRVSDECEADHPRDRVGGALDQTRGKQPRQTVGQPKRGACGRQGDEPGDHRPAAPDTVGNRAHRNRDDEQRDAERGEQHPDRRRARAEPLGEVRQHGHANRVGDDIGERRQGDEPDGGRSRCSPAHS